MTNEANDILKQAKNGSVAAIIQVLNEKLTDSGVRTRAMFADGMLQLLCEGQTLDQLDQPILVERIRHILEGIAPRNIRRVNIYSRIVREQQLLWLDEINRDRDNQLLWSEEITLKQPSFLKRLQEDWANREDDGARTDRTKAAAQSTTSAQKIREKRQFWRGLLGGTIASCALLAAGWLVYTRYGTTNVEVSTPNGAPPNGATEALRSPTPNPAVSPAPASRSSDAFADAVRLAEQTSQSSQTAGSTAEWLNLAAQWQKASELMAEVEPGDARYQTAQDRVQNYRQNSQIALQKARQTQANEPTTSPGSAPDSSPRPL
ncbi:MAG: hypothetical protein NW220_18550 [Leptolyngbyaceae cyanobacterium bins.349]|nr:hypothetical protein [Leptolyngbyaceae cyanobacterium bins.349]